MYEEFAVPYYRRAFGAVGGGLLHYCGRAINWNKGKVPLSAPRAINLGRPQFHNFGDVQRSYLDKHIVILGWGHDVEPAVMESAREYLPRTGISLTCRAGSADAAKRIYEKHREAYL